MAPEGDYALNQRENSRIYQPINICPPKRGTSNSSPPPSRDFCGFNNSRGQQLTPGCVPISPGSLTALGTSQAFPSANIMILLLLNIVIYPGITFPTANIPVIYHSISYILLKAMLFPTEFLGIPGFPLGSHPFPEENGSFGGSFPKENGSSGGSITKEIGSFGGSFPRLGCNPCCGVGIGKVGMQNLFLRWAQGILGCNPCCGVRIGKVGMQSLPLGLTFPFPGLKGHHTCCCCSVCPPCSRPRWDEGLGRL